MSSDNDARVLSRLEFVMPMAMLKTACELQRGVGATFLSTNLTKMTATRIRLVKKMDESVSFCCIVTSLKMTEIHQPEHVRIDEVHTEHIEELVKDAVDIKVHDSILPVAEKAPVPSVDQTDKQDTVDSRNASKALIFDSFQDRSLSSKIVSRCDEISDKVYVKEKSLEWKVTCTYNQQNNKSQDKIECSDVILPENRLSENENLIDMNLQVVTDQPRTMQGSNAVDKNSCGDVMLSAGKSKMVTTKSNSAQQEVLRRSKRNVGLPSRFTTMQVNEKETISNPDKRIKTSVPKQKYWQNDNVSSKKIETSNPQKQVKSEKNATVNTSKPYNSFGELVDVKMSKDEEAGFGKKKKVPTATLR